MILAKLTNWACECDRCEHTWTTRDESVPSLCPKCKSKAWGADLSAFVDWKAASEGKPDPDEIPLTEWIDVGEHWDDIEGEMAAMEQHYKTKQYRRRQ